MEVQEDWKETIMGSNSSLLLEWSYFDISDSYIYIIGAEKGPLWIIWYYFGTCNLIRNNKMVYEEGGGIEPEDFYGSSEYCHQFYLCQQRKMRKYAM